MEMKRASRTKGAFGKDKSNMNSSLRAEQASAKMYDQLSNVALNVTDMAVTNAINAEIRDAKVEGEIKGIEATQVKDGKFKGYEEEDEIFKWDIASNKSAKTSFEANVDARASSAMKDLAKSVNGNMGAYETVSKEYMSSTVSGLQTEAQKKYAVNSWAKYSNANRYTVTATGIKIEGKKAKDGWENGRATFEEDYGVMLQSISRDKREIKRLRSEGDDAGANKLNAKIIEKEKMLKDFRDARIQKGEGGKQLGTLTEEGIKGDTHIDIGNALATSFTRDYNNADTYDEKADIIDAIKNMPEKPSSEDGSDEQWFMSPKRKEKLLKALDDQELQEQKMWKSRKAREDKVYAMDKKESMDDINMQMLDDDLDELTLDDLSDALDLGYINHKEYSDYRERVLNGNPVQNDNMTTYASIETNIEDWSSSDIAKRTDLTDASMKTLINKRAKWEEEGEKWMTLPAYTKGRSVIRDSYGYPEKGIIPDFVTHAKRKRYNEMLDIEREYRERVEAEVSKGNRYNGISIAEELIDKQRENLASQLHNSYVDGKIIKHDTLKKEAEKTNTTLNEVLQKQLDKNPDTYYDAKRSGAPDKDETKDVKEMSDEEKDDAIQKMYDESNEVDKLKADTNEMLNTTK